MASYIDKNGHTQQIKLDTHIYREAHEAGVSVETLLNDRHEVAEGDASAFKQVCASVGLFTKGNHKAGIRATRIKDVMNGTGPCLEAAATRNDVPTSRILYQAAILSTIEDKLAEDLDTAAGAFDKLVAVKETIEGTEFKRAILNYDGPEKGRSQQVAQLARPSRMLVLTTSDRSQSIPSEALGIQWSDQAESNVGLDIIALSVARQVAVQRDERAGYNLLSLLNGDEDMQMGALSAISGMYTSGSLLGEAPTAAGELTHRAWVKWLYRGRSYRRINWVVTDIDGALAIENRKGKPVVVGDDATSPRIDSQMRIANPLIPAEVNVYVTDHADWPAGTVMGLDSRYAVQQVNSLSADYQATAKDLIARSNEMRWDSGSSVMRLFDQSFSVLELT